jgi:hypothetical protein
MSLTRLMNRVYRDVAELSDVGGRGCRLRDVLPPEPRTTCRVTKSRAHATRRVRDAIDALIAEGSIERCGVLDSELRVTQ